MTGRTNRYQQDAGEKPALPWWKNVSMDDHKEPIFKYYGFDPSTTVLPKGHVRFPGRRPFPCDVVYERDSAVPLRDGKKLYTDVFRLPGDRKVPAIIHWSPYGKVISRPISHSVCLDQRNMGQGIGCKLNRPRRC